MIFWGPPGVGKTTLARILATAYHAEFIELSAVSAGKKDIKEIVDTVAREGVPIPPVLFLDEIHRFNKAQQDYLLPFVERRRLVLIGATTENPSFEVIPALLSRTKVFTLKPLSVEELQTVLVRAVALLRTQGWPTLEISEAAQDWLIQYACADARKLLNLISACLLTFHDLTKDHLIDTAQHNPLSYDRSEDHYDTISAFIKSMRASNVDGALYYLARMIEGGEDPVFIARRMVVFASEDVGLAAPTALVVANAVFQAVEKIGLPEAQINLAHGAAYLAHCAKNRSAHDAYFTALDDVKKLGALPIPLEIRNAPTKLMKELGYGKGYSMYPDKSKSLLPKELAAKHYFSEPHSNK